jgi:hypothetical protein
VSGSLSPISLALAMADWAWHLGVSPGRQLELAALATQLTRDALSAGDGADSAAADDDPRFRHEAWGRWPFSQMRAGFRNTEAFWREATRVPGMTAHHADLARFFARQWLGVMAPANWLATNPVVLQDVAQSNGAHLLKGLHNWMADVSGVPTPDDVAHQDLFKVGRDVGVTPGKVVHRNRLVELIRYDAQTATVHPEPIFIIPSWIMKFYILDLSPENSMVRYLVSQGHTVYMLSWRNPDASDHDLTMDDYLKLGVLDTLQAIGHLQDKPHPVHAMGYCLGGTLLAIAAAALAKAGRRGVMGYSDLPPLKTLTLLAAQTDFSEPGELGLFIDESQIGFLDNITLAGLPQRQPDGRVVPVPAFARPGVDPAHARIPDGRARAAQRPDGLERGHDAHAGAHAPRIPDLAVPEQRAGHQQLPRGRARRLAGRPAPARVHGRHRARSHFAVALGLQAAPPVRCRDDLRADQWRPQRGHHFRAGPRPPQLPDRRAPRARTLDRAGRVGGKSDTARRLLVAGLAPVARKAVIPQTGSTGGSSTRGAGRRAG